jgi:hypothetical protein
MKKRSIFILLPALLIVTIFVSQALSFASPPAASKLMIGIARHDENMQTYLKPGIKLPERKDFYGQPIAIRTFFTGIFEPWENNRQFIKKIQSYNQLPSLTLEFRSWAKISKAEKKRIDDRYGSGYYDRLMEHINNETVLDGIIQGEFDPLLKTYAKNLSPLGEINLRLFHAPFWFPWKRHGPKDTDKFVKAVRHVHQILRQNGAENVRIVITFDTSGFDAESAVLEELLSDEIIDVIEIDGYNDAWRRGLWKKDPSVKEMFGPKVAVINSILNSLPSDKKRPLFIIGETAFDGTGNYSKKRMYLDLIEFVKENKMDGIVFLDENDGPLTEGGWHVDWTIDKNLAKLLWTQLD